MFVDIYRCSSMSLRVVEGWTGRAVLASGPTVRPGSGAEAVIVAEADEMGDFSLWVAGMDGSTTATPRWR
jgi:hypothetical protein